MSPEAVVADLAAQGDVADLPWLPRMRGELGCGALLQHDQAQADDTRPRGTAPSL